MFGVSTSASPTHLLCCTYLIMIIDLGDRSPEIKSEPVSCRLNFLLVVQLSSLFTFTKYFKVSIGEDQFLWVCPGLFTESLRALDLRIRGEKNPLKRACLASTTFCLLFSMSFMWVSTHCCCWSDSPEYSFFRLLLFGTWICHSTLVGRSGELCLRAVRLLGLNAPTFCFT